MSVEKFFPAKLEQLRRAAEQLTNLTTYPFPNTRADVLPDFVMEMWEDTNKVYIEADLPGVTAEDLDVSVCSERKLRIAATRQNKTEKTEGKNHFREVTYGHVERIIELPESANEETIDARLKNGVLTVTLNKRAGAQTRKIEVKS